MENNLMKYTSIIHDIKKIIEHGQANAYNAVSSAMIMTYWNVGKRIVLEEQNGEKRAEYGKGLIKALSDELTKEYGKGYSDRNLRNFRKFYLYFPEK